MQGALFVNRKKLDRCTVAGLSYAKEIVVPTLKSLTTVGTSLGVFLRLWTHFLVRISTSASS